MKLVQPEKLYFEKLTPREVLHPLIDKYNKENIIYRDIHDQIKFKTQLYLALEQDMVNYVQFITYK